MKVLSAGDPARLEMRHGSSVSGYPVAQVGPCWGNQDIGAGGICGWTEVIAMADPS